MLLVGVEVIKFNNIGMLNIFHDMNFPFQLNLFLLVHFLP